MAQDTPDWVGGVQGSVTWASDFPLPVSGQSSGGGGLPHYLLIGGSSQVPQIGVNLGNAPPFPNTAFNGSVANGGVCLAARSDGLQYYIWYIAANAAAEDDATIGGIRVRVAKTATAPALTPTELSAPFACGSNNAVTYSATSVNQNATICILYAVGA